MKHHANVSAAARELNVPSGDLRKLTWSHPRLIELALEEAERLVDRAEENLLKALDGDHRGAGVAGEPVHFVAQRCGSRAWLVSPCRFRL